MKRLLKKLEDIYAAVAFAEAGEFDTAREIARGREKVLLTLTGRKSDRKSFKYALNICKRIGAEIEILYISKTHKIIGLLKEFQKALKKEGIGYKIVQRKGCIREAIINHTEGRSDIQFVVIESSDILDINCKRDSKELSREWERLRCPLVMVETLNKI
jgi:hypothetical protein